MFFGEDNDLDFISDKVPCCINYCVKKSLHSGVVTRTESKLCKSSEKKVTRQAKTHYRDKVEGQVVNSNTYNLWAGMKCIAGYDASDSDALVSSIDPNATNQFFARFDKQHFSAAHERTLLSLSVVTLTVSLLLVLQKMRIVQS